MYFQRNQNQTPKVKKTQSQNQIKKGFPPPKKKLTPTKNLHLKKKQFQNPRKKQLQNPKKNQKKNRKKNQKKKVLKTAK